MAKTILPNKGRHDLEQVLVVLSKQNLALPKDLRDDLVKTIENGLLPRIDRPDAPLNVVFVGPTGSGKSTLINSVAGRVVSSPGVLRPTTTRPLIYSQSDGEVKSDIPYDHVSGSSPILDTISLIDTPDIDSTNLENRRRAIDAVSRADAVVFVTSALRYADLVPWEILLDVSERGVPIVFVLNRITSGTAGVVTDFRRRARSAGMSFRVVRVEEHHLKTGELLPSASVRGLRRAILSASSGASLNDRYLISGFGYVSRRLDEMRQRLMAGEGPLLGADPPSWSNAAIEECAATWLGSSGLGSMSRWSGQRVWRPGFQRILGEIKAEIVGSIEKDMRLAGFVDGRRVIDLSDTFEDADLDELDRLVGSWLEGIGRSGGIDHLRYRHAREMVSVAIGAVRILFDPSKGYESGVAAVDAADRLQSEVESFWRSSSRMRRASADHQAELAAVDELIEMLGTPSPGLIAANA